MIKILKKYLSFVFKRVFNEEIQKELILNAKLLSLKNKELIESIDTSMQRIKLINSKLNASEKIKVKLIHVNSHQEMDKTDRTKFNIWFGNLCADGLACNKL